MQLPTFFYLLVGQLVAAAFHSISLSRIFSNPHPLEENYVVLNHHWNEVEPPYDQEIVEEFIGLWPYFIFLWKNTLKVYY